MLSSATYRIRLLLLGNDLSALQQRLHNPKQYNQTYSYNRRICLYLVGYMPVISRTTGIRDRLLNFTFLRTRHEDSIFIDTNQIRGMQYGIEHNRLSPDTKFIMSFGASACTKSHHGSWLEVPTPDPTVRLKAYVQFPSQELLQLSRCSLRRCWFLSIVKDLATMLRQAKSFDQGHLTWSGIVQSLQQEQFTLNYDGMSLRLFLSP
jgi:hypothetical protein